MKIFALVLATVLLSMSMSGDARAQGRSSSNRVSPRARTGGGFVSVRGKDLVGPDGRPLMLRGIGLGNWLLPEGYMLKLKATNSPRLIETALNQLVGEAEARRFWREYRERYVTAADIRLIDRKSTR